MIHFAVGVGGGAVYGALMPRLPRRVFLSGPLFGLGVWAGAFGVVAPALGIIRSPRSATWPETAVNVAAHLVYGTATAVVTLELARQAHAADASPRAMRARVG